MSEDTLTRADLCDALVREVNLSRHECHDLVETVLDTICDELVAGKNVKLSGFGSFGLREKKERMGRNPKTGEEVPITPRRVLYFRASALMKDRINSSMLRKKTTGLGGDAEAGAKMAANATANGKAND